VVGWKILRNCMKLQGIFCNKLFIEKNFQFLGENMVKGVKDANVKVLLQGLHMMHLIFVLVYNFEFCIPSISFALHLN
jgi:hypothetical protein